MNRLPAGIAVVALLTLLFAGTAEAASWMEYAYPNDGFAISAPSKPALEKDTLRLPSGILEQHTYTIKMTGGAEFSVVVAPVAQNEQRQVPQLLSDFKRFARMGIGVTHASDQPISLAGYAGLQMEDTTATDRFARRYFVVGRKTYQVVAFTPLNQPPLSAEETQFFNSFRLIGVASTKP
jgi:hypothetical protein